ncbi:efflux RND transporter permease subunit [Microcella frigidaquae]|uniref:HAE1 family hydrophobic/amphiphilic exporter-1 n=1 Tax=Microcella frigidaquae TaxID=424758 RepID=A0A840X719_9MICO|nr:HAE1 family hydrophobic/amphiphilic exporter-1 [Microcella frigidaquae]NHN44485.1 efflux RND transporter permease subunit [Microcella frigidaquae]
MHLLSVFSLRNRALIALVTIVVGLFGGIALTTLKQELIPSVAFPQVIVITQYPGAAPEIVEQDVSTPIETAVQGIPGLDGSNATSSTGFSIVSASFAFGTDLVRTEQRVQLAINRLDLPNDVEPRVLTGSIDDFPILQVAVTSNLTPGELEAALESQAVTELTDLDGVREVSIQGAVGERVTITPDKEELFARGLSTADITDALDAYGVLLPAGVITEDGFELPVISGVRITTADELAALPLLTADVAGTSISDVATVEVENDPVTGYSRVNGEPALTLAITKTPAGNTVEVSRAVQAALPAIADAIGSGTEFTVVFDQAPFIEKSIEALATEGLLGLAFAVIVILIFLLSVRSTIITAISIPTSVLLTFIGMQVAGYTLNILTLGAITIAVGRVVDDSIVVVENIKRHLARGEEKTQAILIGVKEVAGAITAATATTIAVFLPVALVGDITGELFRPFALTTAIALAASLFVSLTIVPVLSYWFLRAPKPKNADAVASVGADEQARPLSLEEESARPTLLQRGYLPVIRWTLKRPVATLLLAVLVLVGTGALSTGLQTNFIGNSGQNTLTVAQTLPNGSSLEELDAAATVVEEELLAIDGITTVQASIGSGTGTLAAIFGGSDITFSLTTDESFDQDELQATVRVALADLTDVGELSVQTQQGPAFGGSDIEIDLTATSRDDLESATADLLEAVRDLDVTAEATSNLADTQPYLAIQVDRERAAELGLSEIAVGGIVTAAMFPASVGSVVIDDRTLSIFLRDTDAPTTVEELREFSIPTALGPQPLEELATIEQVDGPASITTVRGVRSATITVTPSVQNIGAATVAVQEAVDSAELPDGVQASLGGVASQQSEAFSQLGLALLAAILIVYVIMVATFRSLRQPLLLLISVPFAATGAIGLQLIADIPLGVPSLIGVLMLVGIVVTNAIMLIDLVNQYRERGLSAYQALIEGGSRRLRPILMTAAATIFALTPLAIGITGSGGFISQPLAIVVIGGLISSTLLTLVVLPALYYVVEGAKERKAERLERTAARRAAKAARAAQ